MRLNRNLINIMNNKIQKKIEETDYWDCEIFDLKISYFGDEIELIFYNDEESSWKISFLSCYKVLYETDANRRKIFSVKDMKRPQLGYWIQDISVNEAPTEGFYIIKLDLSIMEIQIECRNIHIDKINNNNLSFFWET